MLTEWVAQQDRGLLKSCIHVTSPLETMIWVQGIVLDQVDF